jgi:hypothetical protein
MKYIIMVMILTAVFCLSAETLFEIKDSSNNKVFDISNDGLRVFSLGDTLMVISASAIRAYIDESKGLSRSFSVSTTTSKEKSYIKSFEVTPGLTTVGTGTTQMGLGTARYSDFSPINLFLGLNAGSSIGGAKYNVFIGNYSGNTTTGPDEPDMDYFGYYNTFLGYESGRYATNSMYNTYIGAFSGKMNTNGECNTYIGSSSGESNTGYNNTFIGNNTCGMSNSSGHSNTFVGNISGTATTSGYSNVYFGHGAGEQNTTGYNNTFIGTGSGNGNLTGYGNVFIGKGAGGSESGSNKLYIANSNTNTPLIKGTFPNTDLTFTAGDVSVVNPSARARIVLNGVSGNSVIEYQKNGAFGGSVGYNSDSNYVFLYHSDNVVIRNGKLGVGIVSIPTQKLDVNGNARFRSITSGAYSGVLNRMADGTLTTSTSDIRLKENISPLSGGLDKILRLQGVNFTWKSDENHANKIGFIAQDVEKVLPELVFTNPTDGYKGINYAEITAVLTEAVKELKEQLEATKNENKSLKNDLDKIKSHLKMD